MRSRKSGSDRVLNAVERNLEAKIVDEIEQLSLRDKENLKKESEAGSKSAELKISLKETLDQVKGITVKIEWFNGKEANSGFVEVERKIDNTEYLKRATPEEVNDLRKSFNQEAKKLFLALKACPLKKSEFIEANSLKEDDLDCFDANCDDKSDCYKWGKFKWFFKQSNEGNELVKSLFKTKLKELEDNREKLEVEKTEKIRQLKQIDSESYPIVWITVGEKTKDDSNTIDDFKYGSKKTEKEVIYPI